MFSEFKRIQDFAGEESPVAPFAKSTPKDKYAILCYKYDEKGKLYAIDYKDYVAYKGEKIDYNEHLHLMSGSHAVSLYKYGKNGNLWKIQEYYYTNGNCRFREQKIGRKYQRIKDVYGPNYLLKERTFVGEKSKQSFTYSTDYFEQGCIFFEWQDEKDDVVVRIIERYDNTNRLISHHDFEAKLSNPADIITDEVFFLYYDGQTDIVIQMDRISNEDYGLYIAKTLFSNYDEKDNWLKKTVYRCEKSGEEGKLVHSESREIAYDEASARELKMKFDSLKTERSVGDEYFEEK